MTRCFPQGVSIPPPQQTCAQIYMYFNVPVSLPARFASSVSLTLVFCLRAVVVRA